MGRLKDSVQNLAPGYFALVMATGIIGNGYGRLGFPEMAKAILALNVVQYCLLWILTIWRFLEYPGRMKADLFEHKSAPGYFTLVAGTCILGSQFVLAAGMFEAAFVLWGLAIVLWIALTYTIFTVLTIKDDKPTIEQGITGSWLIAIVATQGVAILSTLIAAKLPSQQQQLTYFMALSLWLWGGMMYIWMISLIFYRYVFFKLLPGDLAPPYWINMGAMAISTLSGSLLIQNEAKAPFLHSLLPFLEGFTMFFWATGTWWIPMLVILGIWRHVYKKFPLRYDPLYWGAVFPLGMYAVCTKQMSAAMHLQFLSMVPPVFLGAATCAWLLVFGGMVGLAFKKSPTPQGAVN